MVLGKLDIHLQEMYLNSYLMRWGDTVEAVVEGPDALHALLAKTYLKKNING